MVDETIFIKKGSHKVQAKVGGREGIESSGYQIPRISVLVNCEIMWLLGEKHEITLAEIRYRRIVILDF